MHVQVYVPERFIGSDIVKGVADPYDYRITLFNTIVDTSKRGSGGPTPMKFMVWNLTTNKKADVVYYDANGNTRSDRSMKSTSWSRILWENSGFLAMLFVTEAETRCPCPEMSSFCEQSKAQPPPMCTSSPQQFSPPHGIPPPRHSCLSRIFRTRSTRPQRSDTASAAPLT